MYLSVVAHHLLAGLLNLRICLWDRESKNLREGLWWIMSISAHSSRTEPNNLTSQSSDKTAVVQDWLPQLNPFPPRFSLGLKNTSLCPKLFFQIHMCTFFLKKKKKSAWTTASGSPDTPAYSQEDTYGDTHTTSREPESTIHSSHVSHMILTSCQCHSRHTVCVCVCVRKETL